MFKKVFKTCIVATAMMLSAIGLSGFSMCDPCDFCGTMPLTGECRPGCTAYFNCLMMCPLIIDLDNDGFSFGGPENIVAFDLLLNGKPQRTQWVAPEQDDAFLVLDLNQNGVVDGGAEMFGTGTVILANGSYAVNGFEGLAQYDLKAQGGNGDGRITEADQVWKRLGLWLDANANGISEAYEVAPIESFLIEGLSLGSEEKQHYDQYGNWLRYFGHVDFKDEAQTQAANGRLLDVFFLKDHQTQAKSTVADQHSHVKMDD